MWRRHRALHRHKSFLRRSATCGSPAADPRLLVRDACNAADDRPREVYEKPRSSCSGCPESPRRRALSPDMRIRPDVPRYLSRPRAKRSAGCNHFTPAFPQVASNKRARKFHAASRVVSGAAGCVAFVVVMVASWVRGVWRAARDQARPSPLPATRASRSRDARDPRRRQGVGAKLLAGS